MFLHFHNWVTPSGQNPSKIPQSFYKQELQRHRPTLRRQGNVNFRINSPYVEAISNPRYLDWRVEIRNSKKGRDVAHNAKIIVDKNDHSHSFHRDLPVAITDDLYLSDAEGVRDVERLKRLGVTHVLNTGGHYVEPRLSAEEYSRAGISYKMIEGHDSQIYPFLDLHLQESLRYIQQAQDKGGKCVVHCQGGVNRSGVLIAAVYMLQTQTNVLETVLHCRRCRGNSFLTHNQGFIQDLVALARQEDLLGPLPGQPGCFVSETLSQDTEEEVPSNKLHSRKICLSCCVDINDLYWDGLSN